MTPEIIRKKLLEKAAQFIDLNDFEKCSQAAEIYLRFTSSPIETEAKAEETEPQSNVDDISESEFVSLMLDEERETNETFLKKKWRKVSEIVAYFRELNPDDDTTDKTIYNRVKAGKYLAKEGSSPKLISTASVVRSFGE